MTIEIFVLIAGLIFVVMMVKIFFGGGSSDFESDTTTSYNGRSFESARTAKYDRYG